MERTEQEVPERELHSVVAGVSVALRHLRTVMPAVHFGRDEDVVEGPGVEVRAAVRKRPADVRQRDGNEKHERIEPDDAQHEEDYDVAKREIDWVRNICVRRL